MSKSDLLKRGSPHYKHGGIQPIEFILANRLGFPEGCIVKYATRWNRIGAGGIKDLRKIIHYAEFLIDQAKKDGFVDEESKDTAVPNLPEEARTPPLSRLERCPTEPMSDVC